MNDIIEDFQKLVRSQGEQVLIHTQTCIEWKLEHENCAGCPSELGCAKAVAMVGVSMSSMFYEPKSFEDYERMNASIQAKLDKLLKAKTAEEIQSIRW